MPGYASVPTRQRREGALDKAILMQSVAGTMTSDRDFNELVLEKVSGAGNAADEQVGHWAAYVESLKYRREDGEIYRSWREVAQSGGDCDDLTIMILAGCRSLGVPAVAEVLCDEQGHGFHVRARVGLPPHSPKTWAVVDPVWKSEREWAMRGRDPSKSPLMSQTTSGNLSFVPISSTPSWWTILAAVLAGVLLARWWPRKT